MAKCWEKVGDRERRGQSKREEGETARKKGTEVKADMRVLEKIRKKPKKTIKSIERRKQRGKA